jgi:hypothetical protein
MVYSLSSLRVDVILVGIVAQLASGRALLGGMIAFVISIYHHPHQSEKLRITVESVPLSGNKTQQHMQSVQEGRRKERRQAIHDLVTASISHATNLFGRFNLFG